MNCRTKTTDEISENKFKVKQNIKNNSLRFYVKKPFTLNWNAFTLFFLKVGPVFFFFLLEVIRLLHDFFFMGS